MIIFCKHYDKRKKVDNVLLLAIKARVNKHRYIKNYINFIESVVKNIKIFINIWKVM